MKIKAGQIYTEKYTYTLDTTIQQFWFSKGRPGGVLELVFLSIYNLSQSDISAYYVLVKRRGEVIRIYYDAIVATKEVDCLTDPVYLEDGDEIGVEMDGTSVGDQVEIAAQWIWHADRD
jgi:hypothetical protein